MKPFIIVFMVFIITLPARSEEFKAATAEWQPYAYVSDTGEISGISVDVIREISNQTGHKITINLYPANRLNAMFDENRLDINFADSPIWNKQTDTPNHVFTDSYMTVSECVFFHKDTYNHATTIDELWGKMVGVVLGYYYPMLEPSFKKGTIKQINLPNENDLIMVLNRKRVDAAVFDTILFDYLVKKNNYFREDFIQSIQLTDAPLCIKLRIEKKAYLHEFNTALTEIKHNGTLDRIFKRYWVDDN